MAVTSESTLFISAAQALASIPFFARLTAVDLARLVPELEERYYESGEIVFRQGEPGDALYLIRSGSASVLVETDAGQRTVAVLESSAYFGEMALLSDATRSASIVALRPLLTWRLRRDRFDALIDQHPRLLRQIAGEVTQRLADTTRRLSSSEEEAAAVAQLAFRSLDEPAQALLRLAALFDEVTADRLRLLAAETWPAETFRWLSQEAGFFQAIDGEPGRWRLLSPKLRAFLLDQLREAEGGDGLLALQTRAHEIEQRDAHARQRQRSPLTSLDDEAGANLNSAVARSLADDLWDAGAVVPANGSTLGRSGLSGSTDPTGEPLARGQRRRVDESVRRVLTGPWRVVPLTGIALRRVLAVACLVAGALLWFVDPPAGLSMAGHRVLVTIAATLVIGLLDVVPDYLLGLLMVALWAATGTVPAVVTAGGLATSTWVLLLASLAIGVAVARSGLLFRLALDLTRRLPPSHALRCAALALLGLLATAAMPSAASRLALASPIAQDIADSLREAPGSRRAAGLGLATFVGFGQLGTSFLTGSSATLVAYGLLPPEVQVSFGWGTWAVAALPAHLILLGLTILFIAVVYRGGGSNASSETLHLQRQVLGRPSRTEVVVAVALVALLAGFITQPLHGINPAWLAVAIVLVLAGIDALDDVGIRIGVNWGLLLYLGIVLGFGQVFERVGLDTWLALHLSGLADVIGGDVWLFLTAILGVGTVAGLVLRAGPGAAVLCLVVFPIAPLVGVSEWVVALAILMSTNLWLYPQQSIYYLVAYHGSGGRGFTHRQARPLALAYAAFVFVAVLASIPYWRWLGLIT